MTMQASRPAHVPDALVRPFAIDFHGSIDELFPRLDALRDEGRVLWLEPGMPGSPASPAGGGAWFFTRSEDIRDALQHPDLFSSEFGAVGGIPAMIPIFMDPPDHTKYRRLLNPLFSPGVVAAMQESIDTRIRGIVDDLAPNGECDFVAEVAVQFPTRVFTSWMGLPVEQTDRFVAMVRAMMHGSASEAERGMALADVFNALNEFIDERVAAPTDDLMSQIIRTQVDGHPFRREELFSIAFLLFLAGLDTVAAALSFSFWHLAQMPADRHALATGAVTTDQVVEEMLRRHSFVNLPRLVKRDGEFAGVTLRAGDPVVLALPMASRDPGEYDDPASVDLNREGNRHYAFGAGPHRCLGSHLARLEMQCALDAWHSRIPDYELGGEVGAYGGTVMGVSSLPLRWIPAP